MKNNITIEGVNGRPALTGQICAQKIANVGSYPNNMLYPTRTAANYQPFPWLPSVGTTPPQPTPISPDGSTLDAGTAGRLVTAAGTWTFGN